MTVKISFNKAAVERRSYRPEDARQTVKNLFAAHGIPCVSEDSALAFKDKGHGDDFAVMWDIILALLWADWFLDCAASCVWQDEDGEEDVLSKSGKRGAPCSNSLLGAAGSARQFQSLYRFGTAPPLAGLRPSPPPAVRAQA